MHSVREKTSGFTGCVSSVKLEPTAWELQDRLKLTDYPFEVSSFEFVPIVFPIL